MTTEIKEKLYTVEEFLNLEWPEDDENEYELIGGRIVVRGSTSGRHGEIVFKLARYIGNCLDTKAIGKGYTEASCTLGRPQGATYPKPDVCFVAAGRAPADFDGPIPVAPDLVIEVWSPTDDEETRVTKIQAYQEAGVRLICSIHMLEKYVVAYRLNGTRRFLDLTDELEGEDVLPGFTLKVSSLFE